MSTQRLFSHNISALFSHTITNFFLLVAQSRREVGREEREEAGELSLGSLLCSCATYLSKLDIIKYNKFPQSQKFVHLLRLIGRHRKRTFESHKSIGKPNEMTDME